MRPRWPLEEGMWSRARAPRLRWRLGFEEWGRRQRKPLRYAPTEARRPRILAGARARGARGDGGGEEVVVDVVAARASSGGAVDGGLQRRRRRGCGATRPALRRRHPRGRRAPAPWAEEARNSGSPRQVRVDASHPSAAPHVGRRAPAPAKDSNLLMVTRYTSSSRQQGLWHISSASCRQIYPMLSISWLYGRALMLLPESFIEFHYIGFVTD